ncbi:MAG: sugar ABC transporter permease [Hyphomicrobiaceae bacterium]|nr:sugar ABC transporter permease [Hyphomicrobiaceae bacterium]
MGDAGTWTVRLLPWVALAISALALTRVFSEVGGGLKFFGNRFRAHAIGWLIIAAILLFIAIAGQPLQSVFDLLGKSGKIIVRFCGEHGYFWAACAILIALGLLAIGVRDPSVAAPGRMERTFVQKLTAKVAAIPMALVAIGVFTGGTLWTVVFSFTNSKLLPVTKWVGFDQYIRLWGESRWIISIKNLAIYGVCSLVLSLVIGFILAALLDQKIRFENTFRTILLYPFALSFIVTGLVWQWVLNPDFGVQQVVRSLGWSNFVFDPLYDQNIVIFGILIAGLWQGTGFIMCLMLAGLRGIDEDIWKAARVDGIPMWRTYIFVVLPMMRPVLITTLVIIASGIVRLYDLVVAQTSGGPGIASEVPAKYVYDKMFLGQNLAQGFAASTMMLLSVFIILVPWAYLEFGGGKNKND